MVPKVYLYIRFSTPEQSKGDSLRRQTEYAKQYAKDNGLELDEKLTMRDLGLSAYSGEHLGEKGALGAFLKAVKAGKIALGSVLLVESLDRLSRQQVLDALSLFTDIIKAGIKIVTLKDKMEFTEESINANPMALMMSLVVITRANEESENKSTNVGKAWAKKRSIIGEKKLTKLAPLWLKLNKSRTRYDVIPERAELVNRIFQMKLSGKGITSIVRALNRDPSTRWFPRNPRIDNPEEAQKKRPSEWRKSYIANILKSRAVLGEFQPHEKVNGKRKPIEGGPIPDYYPRIVDEGVFAQVQEQFARNVYKGGRTGKVSNLFTHLVKCGYCGRAMHHTSKGEFQYLVCDNAASGAEGCFYGSVRYQEFEDTILDYCRGLEPSQILPGHEERESLIRTLQRNLSLAKARVEKLTHEAENLRAATRVKGIDENTKRYLEEDIPRILAERVGAENEIKRIERELRNISEAQEKTDEWIKSLDDLKKALATAEGQERIDLRTRAREHLKGLIERIDVYPEGYPRVTREERENDLFQALGPEDIGAQSWADFKKAVLSSKYADPKHYLTVRILFSSGATRTLCPYGDSPLVAEYDETTREATLLHPYPGGKIEEAFKDRLTKDEAEAHERRAQRAKKGRELLEERLKKLARNEKNSHIPKTCPK